MKKDENEAKYEQIWDGSWKKNEPDALSSDEKKAKTKSENEAKTCEPCGVKIAPGENCNFCFPAPKCLICGNRFGVNGLCPRCLCGARIPGGGPGGRNLECRRPRNHENAHRDKNTTWGRMSAFPELKGKA